MQMPCWMAVSLMFVVPSTQDFQIVMEKKPDESPVISRLRINILQYPWDFPALYDR
jgi:hypothetical protein